MLENQPDALDAEIATEEEVVDASIEAEDPELPKEALNGGEGIETAPEEEEAVEEPTETTE